MTPHIEAVAATTAAAAAVAETGGVKRPGTAGGRTDGGWRRGMIIG
jgi:hypothetical protein